jgi:hypothetical protein
VGGAGGGGGGRGGGRGEIGGRGCEVVAPRLLLVGVGGLRARACTHTHESTHTQARPLTGTHARMPTQHTHTPFHPLSLRGDAAKGNTAVYGAISSASSSDAERAKTICSPLPPLGLLGQSSGSTPRTNDKSPPAGAGYAGQRQMHSMGDSSASSLGIRSHSNLTSYSSVNGLKEATGPPPPAPDRQPVSIRGHAAVAGMFRSGYGAPHSEVRPKNLIGDAYLEEMVAAAAAAQQRLHHGRSNVEPHLPGGDVLAVLAAYAEMAEEQQPRAWDLLIRGRGPNGSSSSSSASDAPGPPPPFQALLAERLYTDWPCPTVALTDPTDM